MKGSVCDKEYDKRPPNAAIENNLCPLCNEAAWADWEEEHAEDFKRIESLEAQGHSEHCACRQVWGDGQCECDLYAKGYVLYARMEGTYNGT